MAPLTFSDLCSAMDAAGVEVRVALHDGAHRVRLVDVRGGRSLDLPVTRGFDAEVLIACCSLALCPQAPLARRWPELVALARAWVEPADVGVSDRVRPERPS